MSRGSSRDTPSVGKRSAWVYFTRSLVFNGLENIVPQAFLLRWATGNRDVLLMSCLAASSLSAIAGALLSARVGRFLDKSSRGIRNSLLLVLLLGMSAGWILMFAVRHYAVFLVLTCVVAVGVELVFNVMDNRYVHAQSGAALDEHLGRATVSQMMAITVGPFYFALFQGFRVNAIVLTVLCVGLVLTVLTTYRPLRGDRVQGGGWRRERNWRRPNLRRTDVLFLTFSCAMFCSSVVMASNCIYILKEFYRVGNAVQLGGIAIGCSSVVGIFAIAVYRFTSTRRAHTNPSPTPGVLRSGVFETALYLFAVVMLLVKAVPAYWYFLTLACLAGCAYGLFQLTSRQYASSRISQAGSEQVLTWFNLLQSVASLAGFLTGLVVSLLSVWLHASYTLMVIGTMALYVLVALVALALLGLHRTGRDSVGPGQWNARPAQTEGSDTLV
ncbi:MAG: MFS transporter [Alicyclobacillus sp.]|nr:MFS transporter [Alicyclobacillus sp.]